MLSSEDTVAVKDGLLLEYSHNLLASYQAVWEERNGLVSTAGACVAISAIFL